MREVVIAAGGTGGHLFPAQAVAQELMEKGIGVHFAACGLSSNAYFAREQFPFTEVAVAKKSPLVLLRGFFKSVKLLRAKQPVAVIGFGSYHSCPLLAAASILRIPFFLFEANLVPGKVNRLFTPVAQALATPFLGTTAKQVKVDMPLWNQKGLDRVQAAHYFGLDPEKTTVLVFGGSQGASRLNEVVPQIFPLSFPCQVIHCVGRHTSCEVVQQAYAARHIRSVVKPFETCMEAAWRMADCAITRCGSATLMEQVVYEVPALFIPYPHATDNHQMTNALFMQERGGAKVVCEADLSPEKIGKMVEELVQERAAMQAALRAFKTEGSPVSFYTLLQPLFTK